MQFDKPKVTIDLEEYQHLKDVEGKLSMDDWYNVARKIMFAFSGHNSKFGDIEAYLRANGISYTFAYSGTRIPSHEDIDIIYKPKQNNERQTMSGML